MLENVLNIAAYIFNRYSSEYGSKIDEMKLHKMLYFAQRECFIQRDAPLFDATFYGWKYGPVLKEIRSAYRNNSFEKHISNDVIDRITPIMDVIFHDYANKSSWSLSRLTHGEVSWKNSRSGVAQNENSDNPISADDIRKDAARVKERREMLQQFGLQ